MKTTAHLKPKHVYLISNGDLRLSANQKCWPEQEKMEQTLARALKSEGWRVVRAHDYDARKQHGFIDSQKVGMAVFRGLDRQGAFDCRRSRSGNTAITFCAGLSTHRGPILTVANWSGTWPGLVGMLNLNGSMTKAGITYSTLWSEDFTDAFFTEGLARMA